MREGLDDRIRARMRLGNGIREGEVGEGIREGEEAGQRDIDYEFGTG